MKKTIFKGAGVAIVTPFNQDGTVNFEKIDELIEMQIDGGTDAIIVCGTTGESSTLDHAEHCAVIKKVVDKVAKRIPVIAGTGSNDTAFAIALSKEAEEIGVDALLVVAPYYNKTSQTGIVNHFNAIANSVNIPVIVYDVPSRTGCKIEIDTFKKLAEHENIVAVKAASGDISQIASISASCGDKLDIYSGNDDQIVPVLSVGGIGVISVSSNVVPKQTHDICELYLEGKEKEATKLQLELLDLCHKLFIDVNPMPVKEALNLMGIDVGSCRMPLCDLDAPKKEALKDCLESYKLI